MRAYLLLFLLVLTATIAAQDSIQLPNASIARPDGATGNGPEYTATLTDWEDVYDVGYATTSLQVGHLYIDAGAKIYEVTSVGQTTFSTVAVTLRSLTLPHRSPYGAGVVWTPLPGGLIPVMPADQTRIGPILLAAILNHNATIQSQGTPGANGVDGTPLVYRVETVTFGGVEWTMSVAGPSPTVSGSAGNYVVDLPAGSDWQWLYGVAQNATAATSGGDLSVVVSNTTNTYDWSTVALRTTGGEDIGAPTLTYGITITQYPAAPGSVATSIDDVAGLGGFNFLLTR